jgi:hypothetical protein
LLLAGVVAYGSGKVTVWRGAHTSICAPLL